MSKDAHRVGEIEETGGVRKWRLETVLAKAAELEILLVPSDRSRVVVTPEDGRAFQGRPLPHHSPRSAAKVKNAREGLQWSSRFDQSTSQDICEHRARRQKPLDIASRCRAEDEGVRRHGQRTFSARRQVFSDCRRGPGLYG